MNSSLEKDTPRRLSIQWRPQFTLPVEEKLSAELHETVYTVKYQDVEIIVLNSTDNLEEQTVYLEETLSKSTAKMEDYHMPSLYFSPAKGRNFQFARDNWKPLLDRYNVDLVLNGHDHTYARGHVPVRDTDESITGGLGTVYITSVSGPKQYELDNEKLEEYAVEGYQRDHQGENIQQTSFTNSLLINNYRK